MTTRTESIQTLIPTSNGEAAVALAGPLLKLQAFVFGLTMLAVVALSVAPHRVGLF